MMLAPAGGCTNEKRAGQGRLHAGGYIRRHLGAACHRVVAFSFAVPTGIATEGGRDFRGVDFPSNSTRSLQQRTRLQTGEHKPKRPRS